MHHFHYIAYDLNDRRSNSITKDGHQHIDRNSVHDIINLKIIESSISLIDTHMFITDLFNIFSYNNLEDKQ